MRFRVLLRVAGAAGTPLSSYVFCVTRYSLSAAWQEWQALAAK